MCVYAVLVCDMLKITKGKRESNGKSIITLVEIVQATDEDGTQLLNLLG